MVLLEAFGLASAELFQYNRENFQFDNEQRISRDVQKYKMQVERFGLFREDIEDLVKLTVDKMDMYHLVSAVVLGFTTSIFTEGRIWGASPPSYIATYFMTIGCGWLYLLMTVWLSMYASISSHSLGVRLRTRYVRLPIPSMEQLYGISSKLQEFEKQGLQKMFRLPFGPQGTPQWDAPRAGVAAPSMLPPGSSDGPTAQERPLHHSNSMTSEDLLGKGEAGFGRQEVLTSAASTAPAQHVQMFRKLQSKWQCFDAYARVSMSLGVYQIVQAINLFVLGLTLVETHCPSVAFAVTLTLQAVALALNFLDLAGMELWQWAFMLIISSGCSVTTAFSLTYAKLTDERLPDPTKPFPAAPIAFFFQALHFHVLLILASPSDSSTSLPRRFRSVLFLDVFGDASYDPTDAEHSLPRSVEEGSMSGAAERVEKATALADCWDKGKMAQMSLRRWEAIPEFHMANEDAETLWQYRKQFTVWRKALMVSWNENERIPIPSEVRDSLELKGWSELSAIEKSEDVFTGTLIGPLYGNGQQGSRGYYYDLEKGESIFGTQGAQSLSLKEVAGWVTTFQRAVQGLLALSETPDDDGAGSSNSPQNQVPMTRRRSFTKSMTTFFGQTRLPGQVDNLPWRVLLRLTQVLECCWIFLGISEGLCNWFQPTFGVDIFRSHWGTGTTADTVENRGDEESEQVQDEHESHESHESPGSPGSHEGLEGHEGHESEGLARRLRITTGWSQQIKQVVSKWPHGQFFRPEVLTCSGRRVLAATAFAMYQSSDGFGTAPLLWQALPRKDFPAAVPLCQDDVPVEQCFFARPHGDGQLAVWPAANHSAEDILELPSRRPWQHFTGVQLPCGEHEPHRRCLLLAGWDGERLPVLWIHGQELTPSFDLPLPSVETSNAVRAMHLNSAGQLWLLLGKELMAWDVLRGEYIGRWQPDWQDFTPRLLCAGRRLLVAGTRSESNGFELPSLLALKPFVELHA